MNFAVLASGHGGNLQAIIDAVKAGKISAQLKAVISDKKDALALERAGQAGITAIHINPNDFSDRGSFDRAVVERLHEAKIDFVALAGYMRLLSDYFIGQYPNKILNIHPSLLPKFKGMHAIQEAFDAHVPVTGCTIHIVVKEVDAGPIIRQQVVPIDPKDTLESLEEKIHAAEHLLYPAVIEDFVQGKIKITGL